MSARPTPSTRPSPAPCSSRSPSSGALCAWLAVHDASRAADGGPCAWYLDYLAFGTGESAAPRTRCYAEVRADTDSPVDQGDRSWGLDVDVRPDGSFAVSTMWAADAGHGAER